MKLRDFVSSLAKKPAFVETILGMLKVDGGAEVLLEGLYLGEGVTIESVETSVNLTMHPNRRRRAPHSSRDAFEVPAGEPLEPMA